MNHLALALLLYIWCNPEITTISIWLIPRGIVIHNGNVNIFADVIISLFFFFKEIASQFQNRRSKEIEIRSVEP